MEKTMIRDLTKGPVVPQLFRFALPLFASNALQAVYNLVDMVIVGNYIGKAGMSAVSIGGDILHLLTFVAMGFSSAGQVIIARSVGVRDYGRIRKTIGTMFTFLMGIALVIAGVCFLLRHDTFNTVTPVDYIGSDSIAQVTLHYIPEEYQGVPLSKTGLRADTGIMVMLVEHPGKKAVAAGADTVFTVGDKLTVFGDYATIRKSFHAREHFSDS